ncbi:hypothetical protein ACMXYO_15440 [Neptuniibacter sp. QD37_6]|uniref:hypothetical protein n=1 Tax=Neptuniibacter sp. QD37_6 TaxID=3398210 RepID=UPI0039F60087
MKELLAMINSLTKREETVTPPDKESLIRFAMAIEKAAQQTSVPDYRFKGSLDGEKQEARSQ